MNWSEIKQKLVNFGYQGVQVGHRLKSLISMDFYKTSPSQILGVGAFNECNRMLQMLCQILLRALSLLLSCAGTQASRRTMPTD